MKVTVINNISETVHCDGGSGLVHLDEKYRNAEKHPDIKKYKPSSVYGEAYLAKFDNSEYFSWIAPISSGRYRSCDPVFAIEV